MSLFLATCPDCQLPFIHHNQTFNSCITEDAHISSWWCPTAVYPDRTIVKNAWDYCPKNNLPSCGVAFKKDGAVAGLCETKQSVDDLVAVFPDLSKMNPKRIAEILAGIGSPFSCSYLDYRADLQTSWNDPRLTNDQLKVVLTFDSLIATQDILKDVDYNFDMFLSDIGNSFGLLLGLSLSGVIANLAASIKDLFMGNSKALSRLSSFVDVLQWTAVLTTALILILQAFSRDFIDIIPFNLEPSLSATSFNLDEAEIMIGFNKGIYAFDFIKILLPFFHYQRC